MDANWVDAPSTSMKHVPRKTGAAAVAADDGVVEDIAANQQARKLLLRSRKWMRRHLQVQSRKLTAQARCRFRFANLN
jgi:hypothetical protein